MRVLCLLDSVVRPGDRWLWDYLPPNDDEVDLVWVTAPDWFPKWGKLLTYYPVYVWLALRALVRTSRKHYDVIVAWEGKNGFPLALIRALLGLRRPRMVILAYSHRGLVRHFPMLAQFALQSVDCIAVTSEWEAEHYGESLGLGQSRVSFCPLGWYDSGQLEVGSRTSPGDRFVFASGRSYRDYATLAAAVRGLECRVVVNARKFSVRGIQFPPQVEVNDLLPAPEFWRLLARSWFVVVPLVDVPHAAGDSHIVQAMAAGKAVIATQGPSAETYVEDGVTGLLVPPRDPNRLREAMRCLLDHPEEAERMGRNARRRYEEQHTFEAFARRTRALLRTVCDGPSPSCRDSLAA